MSSPISLNTARLLLRPWQTSDLPAFARLNADPQALQYYPATLDRAQSDALAQRSQHLIEQQGWGQWAVQEQASGQFVGMVGLNIPVAKLHFQPCVEVVWRLLPEFWGKGYATEAARASVDFGFHTLKLAQIVAYTTELNLPSQAVMERLGMQRQPGTFDHPALPAGHPLAPHVLYTQNRSAWPADR
ncbi:GNAT family N-acetyltransferase [Alcaligenes sp. SDU_A2]|uniref:GNAT family N-acetyltransferase n=1 Tax=Alcaligenes sp. SDU_A2 TaxID=3136634 RepID=UPI00311EB383